MAIAEMLKVAIVGFKDDAERVTDIMQKCGAVQVESFQYESLGSGRLDRTVDIQSGIAHYESFIQDMKYVLDFMDKHKELKKSFMASFIGWHYRIGEKEYGKYVDEGEALALRLTEEARNLDTAIASVNERIMGASHDIELLAPWKDLGIAPSSYSGVRSVDALFFSKEKSRREVPLSEVLEDVKTSAAWQDMGFDERCTYCLVLAEKSSSQAVSEAMATAGYALAELPWAEERPDEAIARLNEELSRLNGELAVLVKKAVSFCDNRAAAFSLFDHFSNKKSQHETASGFMASGTAFLLEGWIRKDRLAPFEKAVKAEAPKAAVMTRQPAEDEDVPVDLINKGVFFPFEAVTRIMGLPRQGSIDPTPLLAVFFFIYFGTCMGDAIYGVILTLASLYMMKKIKTAGMGTMLLQLMTAGGIATIIFGILTGGYFGDLFSRWIKPLWFDPMSENGPLIFLGYAFAMGAFQVLFGMGIKAWDNVRNGKWLSAIYDQGFWVVLLLGVGLLIGGGALGEIYSKVGKYMAIAGAIGLVLTQGRHQPNLILKLGSGIVSLYNITTFMSDIVSYSRLFGLGFTSIVIGIVINYMAKMLLGVPVVGYLLFLVVLVFGHMFNLLINVTSAFIHSARLQYVEFFGKFADFGGTKFEPFRVFNKYVDIDIEEAK
ncbi:MAG TPA: V-type ATP synthase subunit I [Bacillota bacterium]|nr:V-type ATP synthase subunit I [Bacillota bacterium]HOH09669.1 V-type ATP synthase subunit I [Bacillota bacterium]HOY88996.1 V-type ATP synthase subunit I [Bacillota bacterium]HPI00556.1 V-type ATP synthase subunit I [Bacillota bacterium]HPM62978.1 V-type ATP synthase subunit I [Bacillota bacterium]